MPKIEADMTASVWKVLVKEGDQIQSGDTVAILESMKMEVPVLAEDAGIVVAVHVAPGDVVSEGDALVETS